jgi:adenylylsulfate kinase-like enzyme
MSHNTNKVIIWIMGPTSSGKTTIAENIVNKLRSDKKLILHYDGDEVRNFFGSSFGFENKNRVMVVETLIHLANKSLDAGVNVIISALTANQDARDLIKIKSRNLIVIYLKCSINECSRRDPKGLYKAARNGEIDTLIGFNKEYIPPKSPDITIDTENTDINECVDYICSRLKGKLI